MDISTSQIESIVRSVLETMGGDSHSHKCTCGGDHKASASSDLVAEITKRVLAELNK